MKKLVILFCICYMQMAKAQTQQLVKIAGTKCSLIPPSGFVVATRFSGFQSAETGASIMINELLTPYATLVTEFTADALKSSGMTLLKKETQPSEKFMFS
jgi:hypothetical protein